MGELISLKTTNSSAKNNGEYTDTSTSKYNLDNNYSEYFKKLAKEPLLTKQEEQTLAKNIESEARSLMQVICSYKNSKEELEGLNILEQKIYAKLSEKEKVKVETRGVSSLKKTNFYKSFYELKTELEETNKSQDQQIKNNLFNLVYYSEDCRSENPKKVALGRKKIFRKYLIDSAKELSSKPIGKYSQKVIGQSLERIEKNANTFVKKNVRLVIKQAFKKKNRGLSIIDLVQEGCIGLAEAAVKFDYRTDFKFATYAIHWINQKMEVAINKEQQFIKTTSKVGQIAGKYIETSAELIKKLEREPTHEEVAEEMNRNPDYLYELLAAGHHPVSLHELVKGDGQTELIELIENTTFDAPDLFYEKKEDITHLLRLINTVHGRNKAVLLSRYGLNPEKYDDCKTLNELSEEFGVCRERIRQLEQCTLELLREKAKEDSKECDFIETNVS
ncbi:sigma-70 family RNA polymerase sigma factor [Candidatus Woesearchaeota archaeon]|jgi:RNA polymerase primary sigma factor|nr:sigma-70 family RNA polymerase sigma factor [Candidatus Woesearchaeota archaeon]MBT6518283.1 sigma-70 family RNA polymerase sigma factor [Candidatus Woesearchaeota archaeon]MBT7367066.1 sigma-70 family RNA polymerase sigma factor [Candidatus Woesearchaeota archaeon]